MSPGLSSLPSTVTPAVASLSTMSPGLSSLPSTVTPAVASLSTTSGSQLPKRQNVIKCPHCSLTVLKKNLNIHINRKHTDHSKDITMHSHLSSVCVDPSNGLSAVQRSGHGFTIPVHVQRKTWGKTHYVRCELEECRQYQLLAHRSGHMFSVCEHLRSLDYCFETAFEEHLEPRVLDEMVELKFIGESKKAVCLKRQKIAQTAHAPFSVLVALGESQKQITLSIHEPTVHHYNRLGRVMVTYNSTASTWHCPCAKPRVSCPHKNIAKWHLFQTNKNLFTTHKKSKSSDALGSHLSEEHIFTSPIDLQSTVQYIYNKKKIPANLPEAATKSKEFSSTYLPVETMCMICSGETALDMPLLTTAKAKIVTMESVIENISTYTRRCPGCNMIYRYQEWQDGLHNFDDHVLLSLELCLYLRHSLQNHVSVSRAIDTLERLRRIKYPNRDTIIHGYGHFEALTDTEYLYSCVNCGYHPPVVIMDLHKKGVFSMSVSDLKEPPADFGGEVDIEDFWKSVNLEMIARGFVPSRAKNPFAVQPSYERWAPWIGSKTRKDNTVLNTEYAKVVTAKVTSAEAQMMNVSEDRLVDELMKQKVSVVRNLCKACNIDSKGSRMDLVSRLRAEMQNRQSYDKMFQKIWGASGGWSVILCPHGVVYSIKFNLRAESPRDFADLLLSWKHIPNVNVYDFARGLATHGNLRVPTAIPFQPHEGRLAEPTPVNISSAKKGKLNVSLPWLLEKTDNLNTKCHPITGSSEHYVLYDKLHESNTKEPQEVLRRISLVPELQGWLNSQIAEQFFASLRKSNYFLNNMAPSMHIFMMRNIIHHKNTSTNQKLLEVQLQRGHKPHGIEDITLSDLGQAFLAPRACERETVRQHPHHINQDIKDCGPQCEAFTKCENISACRASWTLGNHPAQKELLNYILDIERPGKELIVRTTNNAVLNRADFWTLGFNRDMESTIGNGCFELIKSIAYSKGKNIYVANLHVVPTWLPPNNCDPFLSLPEDAHLKDALVIPIWIPGHYQLCVLKPAQKLDMPELRKWWCVMLMENYGLDSHGKVFAHFTEESKAFLRGDREPVFRLKKRKFEETFQVEPQHQVQELSSQGDVLHPVLEDAPLESSQESRLVRDLKIASKWCLDQSSALHGSVQLPKVLCMEEQDVAEAVERLEKAEFPQDRIDALEPFCFIFTSGFVVLYTSLIRIASKSFSCLLAHGELAEERKGMIQISHATATRRQMGLPRHIYVIKLCLSRFESVHQERKC
ncbi:hypothetical protein F2P79_025235 [Pimephales promelas]|nr:hypothetical protein F2P79_025235 [Pimephales promelas]